MTQHKTLNDLKKKLGEVEYVHLLPLRSLIISKIKALSVWCKVCGNLGQEDCDDFILSCSNQGHHIDDNLTDGITGTMRDLGAYEALMSLGPFTEEDLR